MRLELLRFSRRVLLLEQAMQTIVSGDWTGREKLAPIYSLALFGLGGITRSARSCNRHRLWRRIRHPRMGLRLLRTVEPRRGGPCLCPPDSRRAACHRSTPATAVD